MVILDFIKEKYVLIGRLIGLFFQGFIHSGTFLSSYFFVTMFILLGLLFPVTWVFTISFVFWSFFKISSLLHGFYGMIAILEDYIFYRPCRNLFIMILILVMLKLLLLSVY